MGCAYDNDNVQLRGCVNFKNSDVASRGCNEIMYASQYFADNRHL